MNVEYGEVIMTNQKFVVSSSLRAAKAIADWKKNRAELIKRSKELKEKSDSIRLTNPVQAAKLAERSKTLAFEAERMKKDGISTDEIRRAAAQGRLALAKDKG